MTFWLHRFRKLDVRQKSHRKMLIDTFVNAIFLYDDKMVITFNYKEGTATITLMTSKRLWQIRIQVRISIAQRHQDKLTNLFHLKQVCCFLQGKSDKCKAR